MPNVLSHDDINDTFSFATTIMIRMLWTTLGMVLLFGSMVVKRLYFPVLLSFPWQINSNNNNNNASSSSSSSSAKKDKDTSVVMAGSFNPPHNGHFAMLLYLADRYVQ